ncbi:MAG: hypothetical protein R6X20_03395 [Phycisphaerae bacterium]
MTPTDVEISVVTSAEGLDLRAIATLAIVPRGGEPADSQAAERAAKLSAELAGLDLAAKGIFLASKAAAGAVGI